MAPRYLITIIHGKFSPQAKWARKGAPFREMLAKRFGSEIFIRRRVWASKTGEDPAVRLSTYVKRYADRFPDAQQVLICRSNSGTAALYAMRDKFLRSTVDGIACLESPFAVTKERRIYKHSFICAILVEIYLVAAAVFSCAVGAALLRAFWGQPGIRPAFVKAASWVMVVVSFTILAWYFFTMRPLRMSRKLHTWFFPIIESWQKAAMARLAIPAKLEMPILCQKECGGPSPIRDEAYIRMSIGKLLFRGPDIPFWLLYVWQGFALLSMFIASVYVFVMVFGKAKSNASDLNDLIYIYFSPAWAVLVILLWACKTWVSRFLVFGETNILDTLVVKTVIEDSIDDPRALEKKDIVSSMRVISPNVDLSDWLICLPKDHAKPEPRST